MLSIAQVFTGLTQPSKRPEIDVRWMFVLKFLLYLIKVSMIILYSNILASFVYAYAVTIGAWV